MYCSFELLEFGFTLGQVILDLLGVLKYFASVSFSYVLAKLIIKFAVQMEFFPRQATSDLVTFSLQHGHDLLSKILWEFNFVKFVLQVQGLVLELSFSLSFSNELYLRLLVF